MDHETGTASSLSNNHSRFGAAALMVTAIIYNSPVRTDSMSAAETTEAHQLLKRLIAEQVLYGVEDWTRVRLHRDTVLRPQSGEVECRHDCGNRGAGGLMAADL